MCESASNPYMYRAYASTPPSYAPCLCGNTSEPFLWCYAAHAQQLIKAATDAFNSILHTLEEGVGPPLTAQVLQGEGKPEPESTNGEQSAQRQGEQECAGCK